MDVHEEDYLDLPELNKIHIEDNHYDIMQNRIAMAGLCGLMFVMIIGSHLITKHSMEDCEHRLYEKVTGQKIERDLFVEVEDG